MAITDSFTKSIGTLVGIALLGAIFVVGTMLYRNRAQNEAPLPSKPYSEPESGVIFDAPTEWTVSIGANNDLQVRGVRIASIQSQRGNCTNFSKTGSQSIERELEDGSQEAITAWQKQFPGLDIAELVQSPAGEIGLLGIDTCSPSLNRNTLTFRGQTYRNDVEVRFTREFVVDKELSQAELERLANSLAAGTGTDYQIDFTQFAAVLASLR